MLQNTHTHTHIDHYNKTTTAPQRGRLGREPEREANGRARVQKKRMREQQEQTHSLIKGGSLKISQETLVSVLF